MTITTKIALLTTMLLTACSGGNLDFEGVVGKGDAPNIIETSIKTTDAGPVLTVRYREGVVFPNLSLPVTVTEHLGEYEITRSDTKEKFNFIQSNTGNNLYVCAGCPISSDTKLPLLWIKNPKHQK
jgi:hypothetical protein